MNSSAKWLSLVFAAALLSVSSLCAQHGGGPPGGGGGGGGSHGSGGLSGGGRTDSADSPQMSPGSTQHGSIPPGAGGRQGGIPQEGPGGRGHGGIGGGQLGPVGRWWDDKGFARTLNLRPDQRQRMDAVFKANRTELMGRYEELRTQESKLNEATKDTRVNSGSIFAQIDRVAQAREALASVNTRMTDALRKELDADQVQKLQAMNQ